MNKYKILNLYACLGGNRYKWNEVNDNIEVTAIELDEELAKLPQVFSTEEIKVKTTEDEKFKIIDKVKELLINPPADFPTIKDIIDVDGVRINFKNGWGLVRASNTTPVLVTRFESTSQDEVKLYEKAINNLIIQAKEFIKN